MTEADIGRARAQIVGEWIAATGTPYVWGGKKRGIGLDCSGLIECGWREAGVWPFTGDASADMLYRLCPRVEWEQRLPGDAVVFGENGIAQHIVGVLHMAQVIGANHGRPPHAGESPQQYREAMARAGAKVVIVGDWYWNSRRLGVIRAPKLTVVTG